MPAINVSLPDFGATPAQIDGGIEDGLDHLENVGNSAIELEANVTYARPVRRNQNGSPAWSRSGDLKSGQVSRRTPGQLIFSTEGGAQDYEERLANLPDGPDGINRSNDVKGKAAVKIEDQARAILEQAILNRMGI